MNATKETNDKFETLRRQAEQLVQDKPEIGDNPPYDILELIHELNIYQMELEMQNEELRRIHQELFDLHAAYERLYEFAPCGYLIIDRWGIISRINLTGVKLLEQPRQALTRSTLCRFIADNWQSSYLNARKTAGETGEKQSVELLLKIEKKPPFWVRADIEAERNSEGSMLQWRVILVDISAQKAAQEEARQLEDQLRQAHKMESLGTLAGGIAHEINNILAIIMGNADLIEQDISSESHIRVGVEEIQVAALRAKEVVQQLLTFSRRSSAKDEPLKIGPVVEEAVRLIRASTPANIDIRFTLADGLPLVFGNDTQIGQLLINLCSNAADAVSPNNGLITVSLSRELIDESYTEIRPAVRCGQYVKITVRDNGAGMDEETRRKIFEPYFTTKAFGKGTGIGLAVAHGIVQRHKGWITVESEVGRGTLFTILLPVCADSVQETPPRQVQSAPTGTERILFIDDEPSILRYKKQQLEGLGYTVTCTADPLEALEAVRAGPDGFDLIITDLAMPRMTGDRLAVEVLSIAPQIPVILCTGYSERLTEKNAGRIGIGAFLLKPIERTELAVTIRKVLNETTRRKRAIETADSCPMLPTS